MAANAYRTGRGVDEVAGEALRRYGALPDTLAPTEDLAATPHEPIATVQVFPTAAPVVSEPIPESEWTLLTPVAAAERYILDNPKTNGGTTNTKKPARWTDKTRKQFLSAAMLLEKSYGKRPLWQISQDDILNLKGHFDRLPCAHHKSPRHNLMTWLSKRCQ